MAYELDMAVDQQMRYFSSDDQVFGANSCQYPGRSDCS